MEYCQWERFNASCPASDDVILMLSGRYGRMRFGRCMREDHGSVGCSADVLAYLDRRCSGRRQCQLSVPDAILHAMHRCPKEIMSYLEASYVCITGILKYFLYLPRVSLCSTFLFSHGRCVTQCSRHINVATTKMRRNFIIIIIIINYDATLRGKHNVTVWRPSVCPVCLSRRHIHHDLTGGSIRRGQRTFRLIIRRTDIAVHKKYVATKENIMNEH